VNGILEDHFCQLACVSNASKQGSLHPLLVRLNQTLRPLVAYRQLQVSCSANAATSGAS